MLNSPSTNNAREAVAGQDSRLEATKAFIAAELARHGLLPPAYSSFPTLRVSSASALYATTKAREEDTEACRILLALLDDRQNLHASKSDAESRIVRQAEEIESLRQQLVRLPSSPPQKQRVPLV